MANYYIEKYDGTKTYMYPNSKIATPEVVTEDFPACARFFEIPGACPVLGRKAEHACAAAGFNACRRTAFSRTEGRPVLEREAVPQYGHVQGVLSGRGSRCAERRFRVRAVSPPKGAFFARVGLLPRLS